MSEKRQGMRRTIFYYLNVLDARTDKVIGRLGDISEKGILLITDDPDILEHGRTEVKILLPPRLSNEKPGLHVTVESRWVHKDKNPRYFLIGCSMESLPELHQTIEGLIEHYAFSDGYKELRQEMSAV